MPINFQEESSINEDLLAAIESLFDTEKINSKSILNYEQIIAILRCKIFGTMYEVKEYVELADLAMELLISGPSGKGGSGRKDLRQILTAAFMSRNRDEEGKGLRERLMG